MLFPLLNFSSFQSNLMTGQDLFLFKFAPNGVVKAWSYDVALLFRRVYILQIALDPPKYVPAEKKHQQN